MDCFVFFKLQGISLFFFNMMVLKIPESFNVGWNIVTKPGIPVALNLVMCSFKKISCDRLIQESF